VAVLMRAARLHENETRLRIEDVPVPEPVGDQVLVRVSGAGVCRSDLHVLDGMFDEMLRRPVTMGHEIAGRVEATGPDVRELEPGEPVVVMVGWGCGYCRWCVSGHEQLCFTGDEAGATVDGGFAEFVLVPHRRHVVRLGSLDPLDATPFGCAALCSYAAVKRVRPWLGAGATLVIVGIGGLGQYGVQFARRLGGARIVAVDASEERAGRALGLGADQAVVAGTSAVDEILAASGGQGADAVIDFVGTDDSLALASRAVGRRGIVALLGLAGGSVPFGFTSLAPEATLTTVVAGTVRDLQEVVEIARETALAVDLRRYELESVNDALDDLRAGRIAGRAILTP
jgi:propanol-preferring alcohol dehydrogenase